MIPKKETKENSMMGKLLFICFLINLDLDFKNSQHMSQQDLGLEDDEEEEAGSEDEDREEAKFKNFKSPGESIGL